MIRTTTMLVGVAACAAAVTFFITTPAPATPPVAAPVTHMGKTAQQWQRIAAVRLRATITLRGRLGDRTRQLRTLKRIKAVSRSDVSYAIRLASTVYGVSEWQMNRVASCESGHYALATNGQYRGVFQEGPMFERGRYGQAGFSVFDPVANSLTAAETVAHEGWSQWSCKP